MKSGLRILRPLFFTVCILIGAIVCCGFVRAGKSVPGHCSSCSRIAPSSAAVVLAPSTNSHEDSSVASPVPRWEETVVKGVAEGGLSIVSLGFAAFTFLYGALLSLAGSDERVRALKTKLRMALYATAFAVVSGAGLAVLSFVALALESSRLGIAAIVLTLVVLTLLSGIAVTMAVDVYREGGGQ